MFPFDEPNDYEKAENYLNDFKETHIVSDEKESVLRQLLVDYFWIRTNGSPTNRAGKWLEIVGILKSCPDK